MFDLLIKNAAVIDGSGDKPFTADLAASGGLIKAVEPDIEAEAGEVIEADGLCLAPGFIDPHTHMDVYLVDYPQAEVRVRQGITTDFTGNCGLSCAPLNPDRLADLEAYVADMVAARKCPWDWQTFGQYMDRLGRGGLALNAACLVGHGTIRAAVMGFDQSLPDAAQMAAMKDHLEEALTSGSLGMTSGLIYPPGYFSDTAELVELSKVIARFGAVHASHIRNESDDVLEAVAEIIEIGRRSGAAVHISHIKIMGPRNWDKIDRMIELLETGRQSGVDVTADIYPYLASQTGLLTLLPKEALDGGVSAAMARLADPAQRPDLISQIAVSRGDIFGWDKITINRAKTEAGQEMIGRSLAELAEDRGLSPAEAVAEILTAEDGAVGIICEAMSEEVQSKLMALDYVMIGSDSGGPTGVKPHPRTYGTFPRILRRQVREMKLLSLEQAVRKMTALTADRFGLTDRGRIAPGKAADLVLFNKDAAADQATFERPKAFPIGIEAVFTAGQAVFQNGGMTDARPGRLLRLNESK